MSKVVVDESVLDALTNAGAMYTEYTRLAVLGELSLLEQEPERGNAIVSSVSPVMADGYMNALLG